MDTPFSPSSFYCDADDAFLKLDLAKFMDVTEYEDDHYVQYMVDRESSSGFGSKCFLPSTIQSWSKRARLDAIHWVLKFVKMYHISSETVFLSLTYYDRFLSVLPIDEGELLVSRSLAVGCLSLAIKVEEESELGLKKFKVQDQQVEGFEFEEKVILMCELIILQALEWKMTPISPFTHVRYFSNKFYGKPSDLHLVASKIMMNVAIEINVMDHRPCVIAASTVLLSIDRTLTKEQLMLIMLSVIPTWGSIESEQLFSFYKRPLIPYANPEVSSNLSPTHSSLIGFVESSSHPAAVRIKRKLGFNTDDQKRKRCTS